MINKKTAGKKSARSRRSLAARLLGGAVGAALPVPPPEEPWRNKNLKTKLLTALETQKLDIKSELKRFLPANQRMLLKNFKSTLLAELERNFP